MAVPTPRGAAIRTATAVSTSVPTIVEKMPPARPMSTGFRVRKEKSRTGRPFRRMKTMMKSRMKTVTAVNSQEDRPDRVLLELRVRCARDQPFRRDDVALAIVFRIMMMTKRMTPVAKRAWRCSPLA